MAWLAPRLIPVGKRGELPPSQVASDAPSTTEVPILDTPFLVTSAGARAVVQEEAKEVGSPPRSQASTRLTTWLGTHTYLPVGQAGAELLLGLTRADPRKAGPSLAEASTLGTDQVGAPSNYRCLRQENKAAPLVAALTMILKG